MLNEKNNRILLVVGFLGVACLLKCSITGVGSLAGLIGSDLGLSNGMVGLISTLPLIMFALFAPLVGRFSQRLGMARLLWVGQVLMLIGILVRSYTATIGVFLGTVILGIGIAIGNVLLPAIVKLKFPTKIGLMTSLYSTAMAGFAGISMGASYPIAVELGWRHALGFWALPMLLIVLIWLPQCLSRNHFGDGATVSVNSRSNIYKDRLAWAVSFYMGLQSLVFYALAAWLPSMLVAKGYTAAEGGYYTFIYQLISIPFAFIVPTICDRLRDQRVLGVSFGMTYIVGLLLIWLPESTPLVMAGILLCGVGNGAALGFAMFFIAARAGNPEDAARLAGMSQALGYLVAAVAPTLLGMAFDLTASWALPYLILLAVSVLMNWSAWAAGADRKVFQTAEPTKQSTL